MPNALNDKEIRTKSFQASIDAAWGEAIRPSVSVVYAAYYDVGSDISRVKGKLYGIYTDRAIAEAAAEKKGWYGGPGIVEECFALRVKDMYYLMGDLVPLILDYPKQMYLQEKARQEALRALTKEQRRLLNLEEPSDEPVEGDA